MTVEIATVLIIIAAAVILFITERIRVDLVALIVLVSLTLTQLVTPAEALSGFSNLAVVTVWAVLILSAGLSRTGIASKVSRFLLRYAGDSETRLIVIIMIAVGILSGLMNNIGVAALMLPVVLDLARETGRPPSRLLMPLAFASLLGGLTTLIGTPANILVSEALRDAGLTPFRMFDYTPIGIVVLLVGTLFMAVLGRRLLPSRVPRTGLTTAHNELDEVYDFSERLFSIRLPSPALLDGKSLAESRLGSALGLNVIAILRNNQTQLAPEPNTILYAGDEMVVGGRLDLLDQFRSQKHLIPEDNHMTIERLISSEVSIGELKLASTSSLFGQTLIESDFRNRFGINVLALWRNEAPIQSNLQNVPLQRGDTLLVQGAYEKLDETLKLPDFESLIPITDIELAKSYYLHDGLLTLRVPPDSVLIGKSLMESQLGDAFGMGVLGIIRDGRTQLVPRPDEPILVDDLLLVEGEPDDLKALRGLKELIIDQHLPDLYDLESEAVGLAEVVISPRTSLVGKTLRELHFREKYGLSVLAIWRDGVAHRSNLRNVALKFGDALLLYGRREKLKVLGSEPDFLVLTVEAQEAPRVRKAPLALAIIALVLVPVVLDWLPISISAVMGIVLMVLTGVLTMDEAYRAIEWKIIFLIAGMLPLGIALERTGAAHYLGEGVVSLFGGLGPMGLMAGLAVVAAIASQVIPNAAVAVLLAPVALSTASDMGVSPYPLMMALAASASASFLTPVGHSSLLLVMGPGRYRFRDYLKVGVPLTIVVLIAVLIVLPIIWSF